MHRGYAPMMDKDEDERQGVEGDEIFLRGQVLNESKKLLAEGDDVDLWGKADLKAVPLIACLT